MTTELVDQFLQCIEGGRMSSCTVLADDAVLEATVPNWRFTVHGAGAVAAELGRWYADPGRFEDVRRVPIPDGELVEFTLSWEEGGVPHACHQIHVLQTGQGGIVSDRAWCGGRWPASLLAEMAAAAPAAF